MSARTAFLVSLLLTFAAPVWAASVASDAAIAPPQVSEFEYPPIRLEAAVQLADPFKKAQEELVEQSQVMEDMLHMSGAVLRDPELEKIMGELIPLDQLGPKAKGFYYRVYVIKDPNVNAMAVPSGSIYINTGMLAALENFDQLRAVLAHETHHVIDQDIVYEYKRFKDQTGFINMAQLIAAPAVAIAISESDSGTASTIANIYTATSWAVNIAYHLSVFGYSREHENECDLYAAKVLHEHHYELNEAEQIFNVLEMEWQRYGDGSFRSHFFMTHETGKQRAGRIKKFIEEKGYKSPVPAAEDRRYHEVTRRARLENARINIKLRRVQHALDDLEQLRRIFPDEPLIPTLIGDAYAKMTEDHKALREEVSPQEWRKLKIKNEEKEKAVWAEKAKVAFAEAIGMDSSFSEAYKGLGLFHYSLGEYADAKEALGRYQKLAPGAKDARYIQARIEKSEKLLEKKKKEEEERERKKQGRSKRKTEKT